ncbi:hypothetical protein GQ597_00740 [Gilliamella sp. Pra-s65]|uniref:hypothetical protein n=1 Tax=unclassified Gilliamella TaxID=2685620 RepID=UPI001365D8C5|nr:MULTISPECIES: hypothetical protein [unclassified Gilliamella]MWN89250.1 hypothetical protein [Gilliamella sp. Pra-s65]MWP72293.1 hypothetical protein [Gilliamella sp. Pra-s52]
MMLGRILNGYYSDLDGDYYITTNPLVRDGIALLYWIGFTSIILSKFLGLDNPIKIFKEFYNMFHNLGCLQGFGILIIYFFFTSFIFGWLPSMFTLRILKIVENIFGK